jgi:signal transduction histidine kinase
MAWKQSHLIRSPLANLKGLAVMLKDDPSDAVVLGHIEDELGRMDTIIIEMAGDASNHDL